MENEKPLPIELIEEYIEDWNFSPPYFIVHPKNKLVDVLIMEQHRTFLTGEPLSWFFIATANIIPPEKMNGKAENLYRTLKMNECELEWKGLIRKQPIFKPFKGLTEFIKRSGLPIKVRHDISSILNKNLKLIELIKKLRPNRIIITLYSSTLKHRKRREREFLPWMEEEPGLNDLFMEALEFYKKPSEITFVIFSEKTFTFPIVQLSKSKCKFAFTQMFNLLTEISRTLRESVNLQKVKC